jgi:hypothetical protein
MFPNPRDQSFCLGASAGSSRRISFIPPFYATYGQDSAMSEGQLAFVCIVGKEIDGLL